MGAMPTAVGPSVSGPVGQSGGFREVVRRFALPVYLPTLAQASGLTAIAPVVPLVALDLGFGVAAAAALGLITGVLGVLGPVPAGRTIGWLGERVAMVLTGVAVVAAFVAGAWIVHDASVAGTSRAHRSGLVAVLVVLGLGMQVWVLARQSYIGAAVAESLRARAMSTFGGMMRIGQVVGPALGAVAASAAGLAAVFGLAAFVMLLATAMVALFLVPQTAAVNGRAAVGGGAVESVPSTAPATSLWRDPRVRDMVRVALGAAPLQMARVTRPLVLPLVGAGLGLGAEAISAVFAAAALVEIVLFVPAGGLMDKYGRTAVIVPCLVGLGVGYVMLAVLATTWGTRSPTAALVSVGATALVLALGNGLGAGVVMTLGLDLSPENDRGRHLARWMAMTGVGPLAGPLVVSVVTMVAPVAMSGAVIGAMCLSAGAWLVRILPGLTPNPPAGPFHRGS